MKTKAELETLAEDLHNRRVQLSLAQRAYSNDSVEHQAALYAYLKAKWTYDAEMEKAGV